MKITSKTYRVGSRCINYHLKKRGIKLLLVLTCLTLLLCFTGCSNGQYQTYQFESSNKITTSSENDVFITDDEENITESSSDIHRSNGSSSTADYSIYGSVEAEDNSKTILRYEDILSATDCWEVKFEPLQKEDHSLKFVFLKPGSEGDCKVLQINEENKTVEMLSYAVDNESQEVTINIEIKSMTASGVPTPSDSNPVAKTVFQLLPETDIMRFKDVDVVSSKNKSLSYEERGAYEDKVYEMLSGMILQRMPTKFEIK